jgi:hypothetical protein
VRLFAEHADGSVTVDAAAMARFAEILRKDVATDGHLPAPLRTSVGKALTLLGSSDVEADLAILNRIHDHELVPGGS